jgi:hypothetical protein
MPFSLVLRMSLYYPFAVKKSFTALPLSRATSSMPWKAAQDKRGELLRSFLGEGTLCLT